MFGLATFGYASADQAGRRLAAVQLVTTRIASVAEAASAFGVNTATLWRWTKAFTSGGVLALVAERRGPKGPSKLTEALAARIVELEAAGLTLLQIALQAQVSTATVRVALGRVTVRNQQPTQEQDEPASFVDAAAGRHRLLAAWPVVGYGFAWPAHWFSRAQQPGDVRPSAVVTARRLIRSYEASEGQSVLLPA